MLKQKSQKGFTIVELLIVIVVIGILAALVLNTFQGVQKRARDTTRQTDVNAIATQLEVYYGSSNTGGYPSSVTTVKAIKGLDNTALVPPNSNATDLQLATSTTTPTTKPTNSATPAQEVYVYLPLLNGSVCPATSDGACDSYKIFYWKEDGSTIQTKTSLNQP